MKTFKIFAFLLLAVFISSCTEDIMDEINEERNDALDMSANNMLPDAILKSGFESTGTDLAWYASVWCEHNAGTWNQMWDADRRNALQDNSLVNNSWNSLYDVMNICKTVIDRTEPEGAEPDNFNARGIAQVLMAYNLGIAVDSWNDVPYTEAFKGSDNLQPTYDLAEDVYDDIFELLNDGIANLAKSSALNVGDLDIVYGGVAESWTKAAYALIARHKMRLSNVESDAAQQALTALQNAISDNSENMELGVFELSFGSLNPWWEFWYYREQFAISTTLFDLMTDRADPRLSAYAIPLGGDIIPAPIGNATQTQGGLYSESAITTSFSSALPPVPMITNHEMKFIEAEAKFRTGDDTWDESLQAAITANFVYHGLTEDLADTYYTNSVAPMLTAGNELEEILTQKYIALFEQESFQAYCLVRRTGIPEMQNPNNSTAGFPNKFPYALSEISSNSANVPEETEIYTNKIFWAQ